MDKKLFFTKENYCKLKQKIYEKNQQQNDFLIDFLNDNKGVLRCQK